VTGRRMRVSAPLNRAATRLIGVQCLSRTLMEDLRKAGVDHPGSIEDSLHALETMETDIKIIKEDVAEAFAECEGDPA